jgi:FO synthase
VICLAKISAAQEITKKHDRHVNMITYVPDYAVILTRRCAFSCGYCDFASTPSAQPPSRKAFQRMLRTAMRLGAHQITLVAGESIDNHPEIVSACRYYGYASWYDYVRALCQFILQRNGRALFLPQLDIGPIPYPELRKMRDVVPSMRLMLHSADDSLQDRPAHMLAPQKVVAQRIAALEDAGHLEVPVVTGITVGIGESKSSWGLAAQLVTDLNRRFGNVQSFVVRPFTPLRFSVMARQAPVEDATLLEAIVAVRKRLDRKIILAAELQERMHLVPAAVEAGVADLGPFRLGTSERIDFDLPAGIEALRDEAVKSSLQISPRMPFIEIYARRHELPRHIKANVARSRDLSRKVFLPARIAPSPQG